MKQKDIDRYMDFAKRVAQDSHANRKKVGAVIAKEQGIILSYGYNGTTAGSDNCCETKEYYRDGKVLPEIPPEFPDISDYFPAREQYPDKNSNTFRYFRYITKSEVIHAEANAILKCAREGHSTKDSSLFVTMSPCIECAKMIIQSGITHVYFPEVYRDLSGIELLIKSGVYCFYNTETSTSLIREHDLAILKNKLNTLD